MGVSFKETDHIFVRNSVHPFKYTNETFLKDSSVWKTKCTFIAFTEIKRVCTQQALLIKCTSLTYYQQVWASL